MHMHGESQAKHNKQQNGWTKKKEKSGNCRSCGTAQASSLCVGVEKERNEMLSHVATKNVQPTAVFSACSTCTMVYTIAITSTSPLTTAQAHRMRKPVPVPWMRLTTNP